MLSSFFLSQVVFAAPPPASPPKIYWSLKSQLTRTGEEKSFVVGDNAQQVMLPSGHRCELSAPARTETPAAHIVTRIVGCTAPEGGFTTGTSASCSVPKQHGVASISDNGKWFVFLSKEASPLNLTLSCGLLPP